MGQLAVFYSENWIILNRIVRGRPVEPWRPLPLDRLRAKGAYYNLGLTIFSSTEIMAFSWRWKTAFMLVRSVVVKYSPVWALTTVAVWNLSSAQAISCWHSSCDKKLSNTTTLGAWAVKIIGMRLLSISIKFLLTSIWGCLMSILPHSQHF